MLKAPKIKHHIEDLFSDTLPINEKGAVDAIKPIITIQRDSKDIHLRSDRKIAMDDKILAYGLAKKLLKLRGFIDNERISANEFYKKTGLKKGSIDPSFKNLRGKFLVGKRKEYEIPNYKVDEIIERLIIKYGTGKNQ